MPQTFPYDIFLSHSSKDKNPVREVALLLRRDGVKVWFDEWEIKPGEFIPRRIDEGLENSRTLILCMSANAYGSEWAKLEEYTFRFRDPQNKSLRFIPLRLDDAPIPNSLKPFRYIDWNSSNREQAYADLLGSCRTPLVEIDRETQVGADERQENRTEPAKRVAPGSPQCVSSEFLPDTGDDKLSSRVSTRSLPHDLSVLKDLACRQIPSQRASLRTIRVLEFLIAILAFSGPFAVASCGTVEVTLPVAILVLACVIAANMVLANIQSQARTTLEVLYVLCAKEIPS